MQFDQQNITNSDGTIPTFVTRFDSLDSNYIGDISILMDWFKTGKYKFVFQVHQYVNQSFFAELTTDTISFTVVERYLPYDSIVLPTTVLAPPSTIDTVYLNQNQTYDFNMFLKVQDSSVSYYWNRYISLDYEMYSKGTLMTVIRTYTTLSWFLPDTVLNGSCAPLTLIFYFTKDSLIIHTVNWHDTVFIPLFAKSMNGPMIAVFPMPPTLVDYYGNDVMPGIIQLNDTICGQPYYIMDLILPQLHNNRIYYFRYKSFHNYYGIDSIILLQLHVHPADSILIIDTICAGNPYSANGFGTSTNHTITGYTIFDTNKTTNQYGCDSITMLQLFVQPVDSILITDNICAGNSYSANGFDTSTNHTITGYTIFDTNKTINQYGCAVLYF